MSSARIKVTAENLRISVSPSNSEAYVLASLDVLTRTFGQKLHFLTSRAHLYPRVSERARVTGEVTVFEHEAWPTEKRLPVGRVVEEQAGLVVVVPGNRRISRALGAELVAGIQQAASRYLEHAS